MESRAHRLRSLKRAKVNQQQMFRKLFPPENYLKILKDNGEICRQFKSMKLLLCMEQLCLALERVLGRSLIDVEPFDVNSVNKYWPLLESLETLLAYKEIPWESQASTEAEVISETRDAIDAVTQTLDDFDKVFLELQSASQAQDVSADTASTSGNGDDFPSDTRFSSENAHKAPHSLAVDGYGEPTHSILYEADVPRLLNQTDWRIKDLESHELKNTKDELSTCKERCKGLERILGVNMLKRQYDAEIERLKNQNLQLQLENDDLSEQNGELKAQIARILSSKTYFKPTTLSTVKGTP